MAEPSFLQLVHVLHADILAAIGFILALAVTCHVLLHKREVSSAILWVGLAWVSPFLGPALYLIFGINRVERRGRRMRRHQRRLFRPTDGSAQAIPAALRPLDLAARRMTGRSALPGAAFSLLACGDAAYPAMLAAIGSARSSIGLATYIFRDDAAGAPFIDALIAAARRGVAVRVLIDGIGSGYVRSAAFRRLHRGGVPVRRFLHSWLPWQMAFLNLRLHKKLLVIDGQHAFTGGLNIGAENVLGGDPPHPVRDLHVRVAGPIVAQLVEDFARDWRFAAHETLDGRAWFPTLAPAGASVARVITSGPDEDVEKIGGMLHEALACARHSVRVITPYFLPSERLIAAMGMAAMRGVTVDVVVPVRGNHRVIDWATAAHVGPLLEAGVRIWRNPPPFDHTKLMVVDDRWSMLGSANWDMRSLRLNFELNVEVHDSDLAQTLARIIDDRRGGRLKQADLDGRPVAIRLRDAAARLFLPYL